MSFTPGIPQNGQTLGNSRDSTRNNFASLRSTLAENHVDVNSANPGLHTFVDMLAQSANSDPITGAVSIYSKAVSGITEWFFQRENSGNVIQMSVGNPTVAATGTTFLPGAVILKWGQVVPGSSGATVTFSTAFPNNCFAVVVNANSAQPSSANSNPSGITNANFQLFTQAPNVTHFYFAVGN